jgi:DNA-binding FadR family transcriptional regulator
MREDRPEDRVAEVERHRALAEAVAAGEPEAARAAMLQVLGVFFGNRAAAG